MAKKAMRASPDYLVVSSAEGPMKPTVPGTVSGEEANRLNSLENIIGRRVRNITEAGCGDTVTMTQMATLCSMTKDWFQNTETKRARKMFTVIIEDDTLSKRITKDARLRTAWAGYAARTILFHGYEFKHENAHGYFCFENMLKDMGYDPEKEIRQSLVVGLTGSLEVDLQVNCIARRGAKLQPEDFINLMWTLYLSAIDKMGINIGIGLHSADFIPWIGEDAEVIGKFFDELTHVEQAPNVIWPPQRQAAVYGIKDNLKSWKNVFTLPHVIKAPDGTYTSAILPGGSIAHTAKEVPYLCDATIPVSRAMRPGERFSPDDATVPLELPAADARTLAEAMQANAAIWGERRMLDRLRAAQTEQSKMRSQIAKLEKRLERTEKAKADDGAPKSTKGKKKNKGQEAQMLAPGEVAIQATELERLRRDLEKANSNVGRLEKSAQSLTAQVEAMKEAQEELQRLQAKVEAQKAEINTLTTTLLEQADSDDQDDTDIEVNIDDTSAFDGLSIVVVGGNPGFIQAMQRIHPSVRCYGVKAPPESAITHADAVWMQTRYIPHKFSVPVAQTCRQYNIPLKFFQRSGIGRCTAQIIEETRAMREAGEFDVETK